jgi:nucleoside-diphosphate-sugar epimerase
LERLINVFGGSGFVGKRYSELTKNVIVNDRDDYQVKAGVTDVVYFISTVDNYNVHTNPYVDIETNLTTLVKVLESCKGRDLVFNFISSWFVYGDVELPAKETSYCNPKGFYSITKRAAEQLLISYCETFGMKYRIIRLANVLGKGDGKVSKKKNALQYMINELKEGRDVEMYDGGLVYRDYIHVDDVVTSISILINHSKTNDIYNVGNGEKIYIKDALEYAHSKISSPGQLKSRETAEFHKVVQTKDMVLDISKIKTLGYEPQYDIKKIIDSLL